MRLGNAAFNGTSSKRTSLHLLFPFLANWLWQAMSQLSIAGSPNRMQILRASMVLFQGSCLLPHHYIIVA